MKEISIINRKARFEYFIEDTYIAGMVLVGSEIKSLRLGNANISEAYCKLISGEMWLINMHIGEWKQGGNYHNHKPIHDRKLLLSKKELRKIEKTTAIEGYAIIPIKIFQSDTGYAKIEIGVGRGKKMFDKREDIKKRDTERDIRNL